MNEDVEFLIVLRIQRCTRLCAFKTLLWTCQSFMRVRFDCGKTRSHYVLMKLESEMQWRQYKDIVDRANVVC